jgi:hypothetical protein
VAHRRDFNGRQDEKDEQDDKDEKGYIGVAADMFASSQGRLAAFS